MNLIEEGFDLAIRIGQLPDSGLVARRLTSAQILVCASPAYLQRAGRPESPADLTYAETRDPNLWHFVGPAGRTETVHVTGPLSATNAGFVHEIALAGHGVLLGPSFSFKDDIAAGRLVQLLHGWHSTRELSVHAVYPHRSQMSAKVRGFIDLLVEPLGSDDDRRGDPG